MGSISKIYIRGMPGDGGKNAFNTKYVISILRYINVSKFRYIDIYRNYGYIEVRYPDIPKIDIPIYQYIEIPIYRYIETFETISNTKSHPPFVVLAVDSARFDRPGTALFLAATGMCRSAWQSERRGRENKSHGLVFQ